MTRTDPIVGAELTTARLQLRPLVLADAPAFFAIHADPDAMRYWSTPPWTDPDHAVRAIADDLEALAAGTSCRFGLLDAVDGLVGCCSLFRIDRVHGRAEIGYILRRSHGRRGLMHEAITAVLDHAFDTLALRRIEADIDPDNARSAATLVRLGFTHEASMRERWRVAGAISDSAIYGLLREEWRVRREGRHSTDP